MKTLATCIVVKGCARDKKYAYLLNLSTMTKIVFLPSNLDRPLIKSTILCSQDVDGNGSGCNSPE